MKSLLYILQVYSRLQYAGNEFRVPTSQKNILTDNSHVRVPFLRRGRPVQSYGQNRRILQHRAWENGPETCVLEVLVYDDAGKSAVSGNALVRIPEEQNTELVPIGNCYQLPVAMWPHDLLGLDPQKSGLFEVIDRNQDEDA